MDTHIALTGVSSGGARQSGAKYGSGVHRTPPRFAGKRGQKEYVGPPISFASQPHHALVWSYPFRLPSRKNAFKIPIRRQ